MGYVGSPFLFMTIMIFSLLSFYLVKRIADNKEWVNYRTFAIHLFIWLIIGWLIFVSAFHVSPVSTLIFTLVYSFLAIISAIIKKFFHREVSFEEFSVTLGGLLFLVALAVQQDKGVFINLLIIDFIWLVFVLLYGLPNIKYFIIQKFKVSETPLTRRTRRWQYGLGLIFCVLTLLAGGNAIWQLSIPKVILNTHKIEMNKSRVTIDGSATPYTNVHIYLNNKKYETIKLYGYEEFFFDATKPGNYKVEVSKGGKTASDSVRIIRSKALRERQKKQEIENKLNKNNRLGRKAKLEINSKTVNIQKDGDGVFIKVEGVTDPGAKVTFTGDDIDTCSVRAGKDGTFNKRIDASLFGSPYDDDDSNVIKVHTLASSGVKENSAKVQVTDTNGINDYDSSSEEDDESFSSSSSSSEGSDMADTSDQINHDTKTWVSVAVDNYVKHQPGFADARMPWNLSDYHIKRIATHTYMATGEFKSGHSYHNFAVSVYTMSRAV